MIRTLINKQGGCLFSVRIGLSLRERHREQTMSTTSSHCPAPTPTAGIIVIGDEILKGQVRDTNSHFISSKLYSIGVRVMKVSVIGDDIEEISHEVRNFSRLYTYVITSGGIGPTHDDVTFEGVAKAFEESVAPHPELVKICSDFYNTTDLKSPAMKLACIPKSAKLKYGFDPILNRRAKYPNVSVQNVYIFPGVPPLLEKSFAMLCEDLFGGSDVKFHLHELFINESEVSIAEHLSTVVKEFPTVTFGSYPQSGHSYTVRLTVEANSPILLLKAVNRLKELLPPECFVDLDPHPLESAFEKMDTLSLCDEMGYIRKALYEIFQALSLSRLEDTVLCVDASLIGVATLHLFYGAHQRLNKSGTVSVLLVSDQTSDTSKSFLEKCISRYSLHNKRETVDLETAISLLCSSNSEKRLLVLGFKCDDRTVQRIKDSVNNRHNTLLCPVLLWDEAQTLQFVTKMNLVFDSPS